MSKNRRVLILKADRPNNESTAFKLYNALKLLDPNIDWHICSYTDLVFYFEASGPRISIANSGEDIADFDLVYLRDFRNFEYERNACALYLHAKNIQFVNTDTAKFQHISKLSQYMALNLNGISVPYGIYSATPAYAQQAAVQKLGLNTQVIVKDIVGVGGSDNYLVAAGQINDTIVSSSKRCIIQQFIPNDYDLRVTVVGDAIGTVSQRIRMGENEHRNNIKQGGQKKFIDIESLPIHIRQACIKAAQIMEREIAGVDVIVSDNGYAILEVNLNFGMESTATIPEEVPPVYEYLKRLLQ